MAAATLDALTTAVVELDTDLRVVHLNHAAEQLLGLSRRSAAGARLPDLVPDGGELASRLESAMRSGQPWTAREWALPLAHVLASVTVDLAVTPAGEPVHGLLLELNDRGRYLRISREESLEAQRAAGHALARGLAHEIKNPLGGLRGAAQLLERKLESAELRRYTRVIVDEADRLGALVDALLGPAAPPALEPVNIHEIADHVVELVAAEHPGCDFARDYDPSLPQLDGDPGQLGQALMNLVRNAAQAAGAGRVTVRTRPAHRVTLNGRLHRVVLCLEVRDDGPGIPPELQAQVFYPLVTTRVEGTGLGLPIAQAIAHRHGGMIECESEPGRTVFTLLLPLEANDERFD